MASRELRTRRQSIESARADGHAHDPAIAASWDRCRSTVAETAAAAPVDCEPHEVTERWEQSPIRRSGIGVEEQLGRAAESSGLIAAITDEDGRILWTAGSPQMNRVAERVGFVRGGRWDERSAGTNALGMALYTGETSSVFSAEHWCDSVRDWVCWAAPVRSRDGRRLGVLDLSGPWDRASPLAEFAVSALGRLVEEHLPDDVGPAVGADQVLKLSVLGRPGASFAGEPLALSPRQIELLAALALNGPSTLDQLREHVYGERPLSSATIKAELSHIRQMLGGGIASRPYELTVTVEVDAVDVRDRVRSGDLAGAAAAYTGQLLPDSEAPFALEYRHLIDVTLRQGLLDSGSAEDLLRFAEVHRYDEAVIERAMEVAGDSATLRHEAEARLQVARET
ncbi:MAG: hypothetical protein KDB02_12075 [Acidimicrobiales bacterium]|nr:hypothetical protein [Acidimicrobiales bacterium]